MKYEIKSGIKEFVLVLVCIVFSWIFADFVRYIAPSFPLAADGTFVVLCIILVYFVYTRLCARFTYTLAEDELIIERKIGRRSQKSRKIAYDEIARLSRKKPKGRRVYGENYTKSIFGGKGLCYIISSSGEYLTKISADDKFLNKLKEYINA